MSKTVSPYQSNWFSKFFECYYAFIAIIAAMAMLPVCIALLTKEITKHFPFNFFILFLTIAIAISIAFSIWWHWKERKGNFHSVTIRAWLQGIIRYFIAFEISCYGFAKILRTQFTTPYSMADMPVGSLTGFELTWSYFGYSYTFAVILGMLQIGGAILLLFRRTSLLGVFVLLPVMVNIVLINVFYHIAIGAFMISLAITFGLIYLLMLRWPDLKKLFFALSPEIPTINLPFLKPIIKILIILAAFGLIHSYVVSRPLYFNGKWSVNKVIRNGQTVESQEWLYDDMVWSNIYFNWPGKVILSPNPYIYEVSRAHNANYTYDSKNHTLTLSYPGFSLQSDTVKVEVSHYDEKNMQWKLVHDNDTLQYDLSRVEPSH